MHAPVLRRLEIVDNVGCDPQVTPIATKWQDQPDRARHSSNWRTRDRQSRRIRAHRSNMATSPENPHC